MLADGEAPIAAIRRRGSGAFEIENARRMSSYFEAGSDGVDTDHTTTKESH